VIRVEGTWRVPRMLYPRLLLDQPPRLANGDGGGAPGPKLVIWGVSPGIGKRRITATFELAGEDEPTLREIAGDDSAEDAHLAAIKGLTRVFTPIDAAAAVATLRDHIPDFPRQPTFVVEFTVRHADVAEHSVYRNTVQDALALDCVSASSA
jgi:hypothetical protein